MAVLYPIFAVLAGLVFGSFLNVCIWRLPRHESIAWPGSHCPYCSTPIRPQDNIPILSWLFLRGRCRGCGVQISARYPLIEGTTAALFLLCFLQFGLTLAGVGSAALCWLLLGLAATDAETLLLPDALTLPGIVLGIAYSGLRGDGAFSWKLAGWAILAALCAGALILIIRGLYWMLRRREGIGLGDAKLLAMIAAWLGFGLTGLVIFLAVVCAAIYGLVLILLRPTRGGVNMTTTRIPLGAFLCAAAIFAVFQGSEILAWYLTFFS